ncbi:peroxisome assembly protein, putative [Trypanosoma equiperdum]|uniref:Peroxisomal ATPase PEX6 n=1 Tax=Trypanosoma equiperdum TaxID=5694 RepID=A0A1G4I1F4_TRYEQ|nr:peroxisome assembly protein, putative [Trypanosoma equiperdum]
MMSRTVELERCILRTKTYEAYKNVLQQSTSMTDNAQSLVNTLIQTHGEMHLGEKIPSGDGRPVEFVVVDLVPATVGTLTESTTVIVLPPSSDGKELPPTAAMGTTGSSAEGTGADGVSTNNELERGGICSVRLDYSLSGSSTAASEAFLLSTLLQDGSIVCVGDEEYTTAFTLVRQRDDPVPTTEQQEQAETQRRKQQCDTLPTLYVSPSVFRNIRAFLMLDVLPTIMKSRFQYNDDQLCVPVSLFREVHNGSGAPITIEAVSSGSRKELHLSAVAVTPAWPVFILTEVFGESYETLLTATLKASERALHGRIVAEGDVIVLSVTPTQLVEMQLEPNTAVEAVLVQVIHAVQSGCALPAVVTSVLHDGAIAIPFRVLEVNTLSGAAYGRIELEDKGNGTELLLLLQNALASPDTTPLFPPPPTPPTFFPQLSLTMNIRSALERCYVPSNAGTTSVFVVHATKENLPVECVSMVMALLGVECLLVDMERKSDEEVQRLLGAYMSCSGEVALVIRNAQKLDQRTELLRLFDADNSGNGVDGTCSDGDCLNGIRVIFLVCECVEAPPPAVAAQARNVEGVLKGTHPSEKDRRLIVENIFTGAQRSRGFCKSLLLSFDSVASWTVGLSTVDVVAYAEECVSVLASMSLPDGVLPVLSESLCSSILEKFQKAHGHNLVSTKLQPVRWSDVGGLEDAKRELREMIQLPLLYPELLGNGGNAKHGAGILFYGPPGCGKTLLAKAVATEMNMNFMAVKGPELINQYVGESEKNIRLLFQRARDNSPCIIFFDELDALAPARGAKGDAGGAMDRVVAQLLVEVDGVGHSRSDGTAAGKVFIIAATNRPDLLDPALLRPGRFDKLCYLGIPSTRSEQLVALRALTRKFHLAEDVDLEALLQPMTLDYTGADLFALCSDAMMFAVEAMLQESLTFNEEGSPSMLAEPAKNLVVRMNDFVRARDQLKPSVTAEDLRRYESLRTKFTANSGRVAD